MAVWEGFEASSSEPIARAEYERTERTVSLELKSYILLVVEDINTVIRSRVITTSSRDQMSVPLGPFQDLVYVAKSTPIFLDVCRKQM
jgi:hypothetical protein